MMLRAGFKIVAPKNVILNRTFQTAASRRQVQVQAVINENETNVEYSSARPFDSIPGPKPLPIPYVGNMWRLMPFGTYGNMDFSDIHKKLNQEYGPMVKFTGLGSFDHLLLFDPELAEKMFRNESTMPRRFPLHCLKYYREVHRKDFYGDEIGLISANGESWQRFRSTTNQVMLNPKNVMLYLNSVIDVCDDFLERIRVIRTSDQEMPEDFLNEISKLSLETFMFMTLDKRIGTLDKNLTEEVSKMIQNVRDAFLLMYKLDVEPSLWRIFPTKDWKKFVAVMDYVVEFTNKYIMEKWEKIKNEKDDGDLSTKSILENLLLRTKNPKIPIIMASDTLFAAIDTTSSTMSSTLYFLAKNQDKQEKLFQEVKRLLPNKNSKITMDILNDLKYTRAVIKESLRLAGPAAGVQRETVNNLVLNNYQIPKGTTVITCQKVMSLMNQHFKNPKDFMPERWLKSESASEFSYKHTHPFVYLPFGFGQRSCIGKRFAYLEMDVVISKIIRNFKVSYDYGDMTWSSKLLTLPSKPLKFKMEDRPE